MDCFASLAMTWIQFRSLAALIARDLHLRLPSSIRGRREDRVLAAPAVPRAICAQQNGTRAYRAAGNTPAFPAQWLYGLLRALPGERLFCLRRPREVLPPPDLAPAPRRPNHTTSPYAQATHVSRSSRVHRISPRVRDDGQRPSSAARRAKLCG
jgi:hypothetical protein